MTVVAVWYEKSGDELWAVADTRVTTKGGDGWIRRTDSAPKIFGLSVSFLIPEMEMGEANHDAIKQIRTISTSFGFAFAGDVTPALMTIATANTLAQPLLSTDGKIPSFGVVVELVRKLSERFSKDYLSATNGAYGKFEATVFGFCPKEQRFQISHLKPGKDFKICVEEVTLDAEPLILGTGKDRLLAKIGELRKSRADRERLPFQAIKAMIEQNHDDVGGSLSISLVNRHHGFHLCSHYYVENECFHGRVFNGINLDTEIGVIDNCAIGLLPGIWLEGAGKKDLGHIMLCSDPKANSNNTIKGQENKGHT